MEIIYQPAMSNRLGDFLNRNFDLPWTHFRAAVAFVKRSGTQHIEVGLTTFARDHEVEIIAGFDHRGTSYEGLESLLDSVSPSGKVLVFHNPGFLTFHPKVFLFKSDVAAEVVIGSGNLTEGGLFNNYELGLSLSLSLTDPVDFKVFQSIEDVLDRWSDESTGIVSILDSDLLNRLLEQGLTPSEDSMRSSSEGRGPGGGRIRDEWDWFPFIPCREPGAPNTPRGRLEPPGLEPEAVPAGDGEPEVVPAGLTGFVMTLQQTDMGVGQTTPGTSPRSPEIFIPLVARDEHPDFWRWAEGFETDPNTPGKLDRFGVRMRLGGEVITVNMSYFGHRHDFRIRSSALRSAGEVGDILRMERMADPEAADYEYYVEVIPQGTNDYQVYRDRCNSKVRNSVKRYGYY